MKNFDTMKEAYDQLPEEKKNDFVFIVSAMNDLSRIIHEDNAKWWVDIDTGLPKERNEAEIIALEHSELSEALEAVRKDLNDDKLPHRKGVEVELADCIIRILDHGYGMGYDIPSAVIEKMLYNRQRADHKIENRKTENGKKF